MLFNKFYARTRIAIKSNPFFTSPLITQDVETFLERGVYAIIPGFTYQKGIHVAPISLTTILDQTILKNSHAPFTAYYDVVCT